MIILDTNVVSELMKDAPDRMVIEWLDRQPSISIWTTAITVLECRVGIERLASGRRRDALDRAFAGLIEHDLSGRILAFDQKDADATAMSMAHQGRYGDLRDSMIAGMVRVRRARLATRNTRHFAHTGIALIDPWTG